MESFPTCCRVCNGPPEVFLYGSNGEVASLADLMADFANVLLAENDGKPTHICVECEAKLRCSAAFRKQVQEAEKKLELCSGSGSISDTHVGPAIKMEELLHGDGEESYVYEFLEEDLPETADDLDNRADVESCSVAPNDDCFSVDGSHFDMKMEDETLPEDEGIVKFPFEMPPEELIAQRMKFGNFEYLEIDGERCCGCSFIASNRDDLMMHSKEKHSHNYFADSSYTCPTCYQKFLTQDKLANHIDYYSYCDIFLCTICNESFIQKSHLEAHQKSHHVDAGANVDEKPRVVCRQNRSATSKKQPTKKNLPREKTDPNHNCCFVRCWEGFTSMDQLMAHVQQVHDGKRRENEIARLKESPEAAAGQICHVCQRAFENETKLYVHQSYKQNREEHFCQECGKCFHKLHALRDHEQKEHTDLLPEFACDICGKAFWKQSVMKNHRKIHVPFESVPCTEQGCKLVFRDETLMKRHCRNVHGETPWECRFCPKKLRTKEAMDIHERAHTGEKPFACRHGCDRRFAHGTDRARHERSMHTGVKPHKCDQCPAAYVRRRELMLHVQRHHHSRAEH